MAIHDSSCLEAQWQSAFHGQSRAGKCERTKQMTFQWQSRASQTLMLPLHGKAGLEWMHKSALHSDTFGSGSVSAVHWQCIGHFSREWLRFNCCPRPRPQRELNCNDYSTHLVTKGTETIVLFTWLSSFNPTFWHFMPLGKLTQDLYKVINSSSDVIGFTTLTGLNMLLCADARIPIRVPFNTKLGSELTAQGRFAPFCYTGVFCQGIETSMFNFETTLLIH